MSNHTIKVEKLMFYFSLIVLHLLSSKFIDKCSNDILIFDSNKLIDYLSFFDGNHCWQRRDIVIGSNAILFIDIDLCKMYFALGCSDCSLQSWN